MQAALNDYTIRRRFPRSIALAWQQVRVAPTDDDRLTRLFACNEIVLRTLTSILLSDYRRGAPSQAVEDTLSLFRRRPPTQGAWLGLVRELIRASGQRREPETFIPEIYPWFFRENHELTESGELLTNFVAVRNQVVHPPKNMVLTADQKREYTQTLHQMLRSALLDMRWLPGYRPFRVETMETTRSGTFTGKLQFLVGTEESELEHGEWAPPLVRGSVYVTNPNGTAVLDLNPFTEFFENRLYLLKTLDLSPWLVLVDDTDPKGFELRRKDESLKTDPALSPPLLKLGTNSSVFCLGAGGLPVESDIDLGARFEKREELGQGGMAVVFRVFDRDAQKEYALKVLKGELAENETCRRRFKREATNMRRALHPHIMPMIEMGSLETTDQPWLKMPVMARGSLQEQIIPGTGRPEGLVRRWAHEALEALQCIHAAQIVHRDIKPSNFLLNDDDQVMLTDFGIALGDQDERWTQTLQPLLTVAYMAPEQATNESITAKTDIYSLAIVLHELLTGRRTKAPGKGMRGRFWELIRRMGAPDPNERPTATEALEILRTLPPVRDTRSRSSTRLPVPDLSARATVRDVPLPPEPIPEPEPIHVPVAATEPNVVPAPAIVETTQPAVSRQRWVAVGILIALFAVNWLETKIETSTRNGGHPGLSKEESALAEAATWFEREISFEHHDTVEPIAALGFSIVYFGVFLLLLVGTAVVCARRRPEMFLFFALATAADYALTLPFYLFFPMPERWAYPDSNAILLSDLVSTKLIEYFRPISGLNNCFPSFHVSLSVVAVLCLYRAGARFRTTSIPLAAMVALSTFALGIHWIPDILAGVGMGIISAWAAERLQRALSRRVPAAARPAT